ncbi:MAG: class I SAM-dependent methyltransferase [Verrucomicrobiota bacterium]|jgi:extracellular factor (EF) 3-hydroxypalmitic acid methyl ester biosynthesis protein
MPQEKTSPAPTTKPPPGIKESGVWFRSPESANLRGTLVRMTRHQVFFELYDSSANLRLSDVLNEFKIVFQEQSVYLGRAVVRNLVDAGTNLICEATLDEPGWKHLPAATSLERKNELAEEFKAFLQDWQKLFKVSPEFKVVVADMQTILYDLRLWLDQIELGIQGLPKDKQGKPTQKIMEEAGRLFVPVFDSLHDKLEAVAVNISEDLRPAHRVFIQRQLHSLVLCSPFAHRAQAKPLGYAGDYEMVNMLAMDPYQGKSLFAKIVNLWFWRQGASEAHRNRLKYLQSQLENEALRMRSKHCKLRIFNFACGPAIEVQRFLAESELSKNVELTLADFNRETLEQLEIHIRAITQRTGREPTIQFQKKNIVQVFKESLKRSGPGKEYDFVYCAGLFDYLPDSTCTQLMEVFYDWLAPGGLLIVTNVTPENPRCYGMENILDWHLIYRSEQDIRALWNKDRTGNNVRTFCDETGVNVYLEIRKRANV